MKVSHQFLHTFFFFFQTTPQESLMSSVFLHWSLIRTSTRKHLEKECCSKSFALCFCNAVVSFFLKYHAGIVTEVFLHYFCSTDSFFCQDILKNHFDVSTTLFKSFFYSQGNTSRKKVKLQKCHTMFLFFPKITLRNSHGNKSSLFHHNFHNTDQVSFPKQHL